MPFAFPVQQGQINDNLFDFDVLENKVEVQTIIIQ
jgi:hypothetical protein